MALSKKQMREIRRKLEKKGLRQKRDKKRNKKSRQKKQTKTITNILKKSILIRKRKTKRKHKKIPRFF